MNTKGNSRKTGSNAKRQGKPSTKFKGKSSDKDTGKESKGKFKVNKNASFAEIRRKNKASEKPLRDGVRLNKYIADAGICSRRDAEDFIRAGVVTINDKVVTEMGVRVMPGDTVKFHDRRLSSEKKVYVLLNKPKDYITSSDDPQERKTVMELVRRACNERIYPVGRLDRNTTGVLLLTNDGELAKKLTHPSHNKKKIYHVFLNKNISRTDMEKLLSGVDLEDGQMRVDAIDYSDPADKKQVGVELHSGKNRVVRRLFEAIGYDVIKLDRVYFAGLTKKNLPRGKWRFLTEQEVARLKSGMYE